VERENSCSSNHPEKTKQLKRKFMHTRDHDLLPAGQERTGIHSLASKTRLRKKIQQKKKDKEKL
jgi:hypothetical protein